MEGSSRGAAAPDCFASLSLVCLAGADAERTRAALPRGLAAAAVWTEQLDAVVLTRDEPPGPASVPLPQPRGAARGIPVVFRRREPNLADSLRAAAEAAGGEVVILALDPEGCDPAQLDRLLVLARDYPAVCGRRTELRGGWGRNALLRLQNMLARGLLGAPASDPTCPLLVLPRRVLLELDGPRADSLTAPAVLASLRLAGERVVEAPVEERAASGHTAPSGRRPGLRAAWAWLAEALRWGWTQAAFPGRAADPAGAAGLGWRGLVLLAVLAALVLGSNLAYPLLEPDEPRYVQVCLEMLATRDFLLPRLGGEVFYDKPPLLYWLGAAGLVLSGGEAWGARLPVAAAAWLTVVGAAALAGPLVGRRAAWLGGALLLACLGFVLAGRFLLMDGLLACGVTITLLAVMRAMTAPAHRRRWRLLAGVALGLSVLAKGPLAMVLCLPPLIAAGWLERGRRRTAAGDWLAPALLGAVISLPWYVAVVAADPLFAGEFFLKHNLERFTHGLNHQEPWWYYFPTLFLGMFPASLLLPAGLVFLFGRAPPLRDARTPAVGWLALAAGWMFAFFSAASCKLPTYLLPLTPALCLILGRLLDRVLLAAEFRPHLARMPYLRSVAEQLPGQARVGLWIAAAGLLAADAIFTLLIGGSWLALAAVWLGAAGAGWGLVAIAREVVGERERRWLATGTLALVLAVLAFNSVFPKAATDRSYLRAAAAELARLDAADGGDAPVVFYQSPMHGVEFHLPRERIVHLFSHELNQLNAVVGGEERVLLVTSPNQVPELQAALPPGIILAEAGGRGFVYRLERVDGPPTPAVAAEGAEPQRR